MVQINLNYIASAFVLLTFTDSIRAWSRMYWYGHVLVALSMVFFRTGGRQTLKAGLGPKKPVPSFKLSPPSPIDPQEMDPKTWVRQAMGDSNGGTGSDNNGRWVESLAGTDTPTPSRTD